jgi:MFS family permease
MKKGNKNIYLLGLSSFLNDIGSEMITPLLPFYIATFGGGGLALGLLSGFREGLSSLIKLFGGWFSDYTGHRKRFVFFGYVFSSVSRVFLAFAGTATQVVSFVSLERFGKLRDPPRDAIITDTTKKRGRGFGIHQMMDTSGAIIGSLIVLLLFWKLGSPIYSIILLAAGISVFSIAPLFLIHHTTRKPKKVNLFRGVCDLNSHLKYLIFVLGVFTLANFGLYLFMILLVKDLTGSVVISLLLYLIFNLIVASLTVFFGKMSDRVGKKKVLMSGFILFFLMSLGFVYGCNTLFFVGLLFCIYGLVTAITISNQKALVADLSGRMKGTAMGFYYFVVGMVNIFAGLIAGILWDISPTLMFKYISVVAFLAIILLAFVKEGKK